MIKINFYTFNKKVNSTAQPTGTGTELDCNIKAPSSIINPVLEVGTVNVINFNYCYIPAFNRYYFIDDIVFDRGIWNVSCTVDVLASFKSAIGSSSQYILRSASNSDGTIIDMMYPATSEIDYQIINPTLDPFTWSGFSGGVYVIGIKGSNNSNTNGIIYYVLEPSEFDKVIKEFYQENGTFRTTYFANLTKGITNSIANISDFIASCRWYPVAPSTEVGSRPIFFGSYQSSAVGYLAADNPGAVTYSASFASVPKHPQQARGTYLNCAPYAQYIFSSSFTGDVQLDSNIMATKTSMNVLFNFDITTGQVKITVGDLVICYGHFGIDIDMASVEVDASGMFTNALAGLGSVLTGNVGGVASSLIGMVGNALDMMNPAPMGNASSGGYIGLTAPIQLKCRFVKVVDDDVTNKGKPYCQVATISALSGYMEIRDPHLSITGTSIEANQINAYLAGGFYYE